VSRRRNEFLTKAIDEYAQAVHVINAIGYPSFTQELPLRCGQHGPEKS